LTITMNVAIFETEHFEGAYPVIRSFDTGNNKITVFCYEKPYRQFRFLFGEDMPRYDWIVKMQGESKNGFIYRIYKEIKKRRIELLYLNTVSNNYHSYVLLIRALKNVRTIVTLHDINGYFQSGNQPGFRKQLRRNGKRWLIRTVREFNVVSLTMVGTLQEKLSASQSVHCVPGAIFENQKIAASTLSPGGPLRIVVPGTVDPRRRNYEKVFALLEACHQAGLPVEVSLLGGYYGAPGKEIIERCGPYARTFGDLRFYDLEVVDQPEFDRVMNAAHIVWIPSVLQTALQDGVMETYGQTISSGNLFDIIKHAKPFIVPATLAFDEFLRTSSFCYQDLPEIIDYLRRLISEPDLYPRLSLQALQNSGNYTVEAVRKRNPALFGS
jgi:hypothetical protein